MPSRRRALLILAALRALALLSLLLALAAGSIRIPPGEVLSALAAVPLLIATYINTARPLAMPRIVLTDGNKEVREIDVLEDRRTTDPTDEIQRRDLKSLITKGLTRAARLILILYYYEEMTMKEIGATLDLSESRVSQMHSSIIMRLKAQMANKDKEFVTEEQ